MLPSKELCFLPHPSIARQWIFNNVRAQLQNIGWRQDQALVFITMTPSSSINLPLFSNIESEMHYVAVLDDVLFSFKSHQAFFLGARLTFF